MSPFHLRFWLAVFASYVPVFASSSPRPLGSPNPISGLQSCDNDVKISGLPRLYDCSVVIFHDISVVYFMLANGGGGMTRTRVPCHLGGDRLARCCAPRGVLYVVSHRGWRVRSLAIQGMPSHVLAVTGFDPECIEGSGADEPCSYHSVITQLAEASYGTFAPVDLRDELDETAGVAPRVSFRQWGQGLRVRGPVGWRLVPARGPLPG